MVTASEATKTSPPQEFIGNRAIKLRALVVEDQPEVAAAISEGLRLATVTYRVRHCPNLATAVKCLENEEFDVALLDLGLPDAKGIEAAATIKSIAPGLPVVVLTGEDFEALGADLMLQGVQDFLQKGEVSFKRIDHALRLACQRQRHEEELKKQAAYDYLTGLANRAELNIQMRRALKSARRQGTRIAVLAIDLDGFKLVNDSHGHDIGDLVLQESARRLVHVIRESDFAARVGGDEFIVMLESLHSPNDAWSVAQKICSQLSQPIRCKGRDCYISASIGIAMFPDHAFDSIQLCEFADRAMYEIKRNGKGAVRFYDSGDK